VGVGLDLKGAVSEAVGVIEKFTGPIEDLTIVDTRTGHQVR
jgi:hypothetical protein